MSTPSVSCPKCGHEFNVEEALEKRIREEASKDIEAQFRRKFDAEREELLLKAAKTAEEEQEAKIAQLVEENEKRRKENVELKKKEIEILTKEQALKAREEEMSLAMQKDLLAQQQGIEEKARLAEQEKNELRMLDMRKQLDDQKVLIEEMKRRAEQGSMQQQGEVMEIEVEKRLARLFPFDIIDEVPKGTKGADALQTVRTEAQTSCGKILYESKRTKAFSDSWLEKVREDQRAAKAEIAVLITEAMPKDMHRFGLREGVWVCSFHELDGVAMVLRESLVRIDSVRAVQENTGDKMTLLYQFLTGDEFRMQMEAIVEGFTEMRSEIDQEKRAMERLWKEREKQIDKVMRNASGMYGSIRGIAGNA
ncbi:MAG: DUF2130 domain-containing protein, partial [Spirochaetota bacterium]